MCFGFCYPLSVQTSGSWVLETPLEPSTISGVIVSLSIHGPSGTIRFRIRRVQVWQCVKSFTAHWQHIVIENCNAKFAASFLLLHDYVCIPVVTNKGFKMILSHIPLTSLNMSSYRAIWTHFRSNSMIFINWILQTIFNWTSKLLAYWMLNPQQGGRLDAKRH